MATRSTRKTKSTGKKKPATKKPATRKPATRKTPRAAAPARPLTLVEKQRLIKPPDAFGDLIERFATAWDAHRKEIRVASVSPAKLRARLQRARQASRREEALRQKLAARLQRLADLRLLAEHDAWKTLLDVYAVAKAQARIHPTLAPSLSFLAEALTNAPRDAPDGPPAPPA